MKENKLNKTLFLISLIVTIIDFIIVIFVFPPFKLENIIVLVLGVIPLIFSIWLVRNKKDYDDYKAMLGLIVYCLAPVIVLIKEVFGSLFELDFSDINNYILVIYPLVIPFLIHAFIYLKEKKMEKDIINKK